MARASKLEVFAVITGERGYQDAQWDGKQATVTDFIVHMQDGLRQALLKELSSPRALSDFDKATPLDIVRMVTALGVACMEQNGAPERVLA